MKGVVNLGRVRKDRTRAEVKAQADANAAKFGRTKAERLLDVSRDAKAQRLLDGHELETE